MKNKTNLIKKRVNLMNFNHINSFNVIKKKEKTKINH